MGPQRCRLPARIVLSTLLAALGLSMAAVGAEAASNGLTLAVPPRAGRLAGSAVAPRPFRHPVIGDFPTGRLAGRPRSGIAGLVEAGGKSAPGTGASWHKTLAGLPAAIIPLEPRATLNVHA